MISLSSIKRWGASSAMSILDQGLLSASNFAINIHLSRVLKPVEYGLFAIVFSVYLLILSFNQALILEPLNIVGLTRYKKGLMTYFKKVVVIQFIIAVVLSILLFIVSSTLSLNNNPLSYPLFALVIASPFMSLFYLIRRFCYLLLNPGIAFTGTVIYTIMLFLGYWFLISNNIISSFNIFILFGSISLVCTIIIGFILYYRVSTIQDCSVSSKVVLYKHWKLGKWILGSAIIGWLSTSIYFPLVGSFSGLEATAAFKAIDNLLLPMQQVITALSLIIVPRLASNPNRDKQYLRATGIRLSFFFSMIVLFYLLTIFLFRDGLIQTLYGKTNNYSYYVWLLPFVGLTLIARSIVDIGLGSSLRIVERFDILFKSSVINSLISLTLGIYLVWQFGILGAGIAIAVSSLLQLLFSSIYFQRIFSSKGQITVVEKQVINLE